MNLYTKVSIPAPNIQFDYNSKIAFIGSCFAENISEKFTKRKFKTLVNPLGIIYNPLSIENMIHRIAGKSSGPCYYSEEDLFFDGEKWNSWDSHSALSFFGDANGKGRQQCLNTLNNALDKALKFFQQAQVIFITLGSAYVYFLRSNNEVVSNCHKQNPDLFRRELISVEKASNALESIVNNLQKINPSTQIVFTVSPLRHLGDGLHGNNISKATLLLAIENLQQKYSANNSVSSISYFPSYEIVMDELRDYRFYSDDMIHLSTTAEDYIFESMLKTYCSANTQSHVMAIEKFMKMVTHKIVSQNSIKIVEFANKGLQEAEFLEKTVPHLDLSEEKDYFNNLL